MFFGSKRNIEQVKGLFSNDPKLVVPVLSDQKAHWCVNRLSFVYISNLRTHQELMLGFNHNDLDKVDIGVLEHFVTGSVFSYKKKYLYGLNGWEHLLDIEMVYWYLTNHRFNFDVDPVVKRYWHDFKDTTNVNDFVPIMKHLDTCRSIRDNILPQITDLNPTGSMYQYQNTADNLTRIEINGLYVNEF